MNLSDQTPLSNTKLPQSNQYKMFLSGHYFFQKIICSEDFVGQFRAYVNVLNLRISYTNAMQILYSDISAIATETAINNNKYKISNLEISQHTHTLSLYLNCGEVYRMSGDGGSKALILSEDSENVFSQANDIFKVQVANIRALTLEKKRNYLSNHHA